MIQPQTRLRCADNSGAKELMCIRVMDGSNKRYGHVGDIIMAASQGGHPRGPVKKGEVVRAVIVRTSKEYSARTAPSSSSTTTSPCCSIRSRTTPTGRASSGPSPASCASATT